MLIFNVVNSQTNVLVMSSADSTSYKKMQNSKRKAISHFNDSKYGMFIHWGLYAVPGGVWKNQKMEDLKGPKVAEWIQLAAQIPRNEYAELAKQFNPTNFDATAIAKLIKSAGMKYLVVTAKHHDGFALYDSEVSDFNMVDATPYKADIIDALYEIKGAYSFGLLTNKKLIGIRDPLGIRPLVMGSLGKAKIISSETCALDIIGAKFVREIKCGEIIAIDKDGMKSYNPFPNSKERPCIFEYIYFARPDSIMSGVSVYEYRKKMGMELAKECKTNGDIIIPVPDSGVPAALGYSIQSKIPFDLGIIRNHYVGRTFIEPTQKIRQLGIKLKHNPNKKLIKGKKVVLIDDSIVRGTTAIKIVEMVREAEASEVHMRVSSPPIKFPDFYGIDTPKKEELLAANYSIKEMEKKLKLDSLHFLSIDGLYKSMGLIKRNSVNPQFTDHCFSGEYPTELTDKNEGILSSQLSLLSDN